jgi:hypothetical protein
MAHRPPRFNGRASGSEAGVLQNLDPADGINQGHIKAHLCQKALRLSGDKVLRRAKNALHLPIREALGRAGEIPALFDLDKNHPVIFTKDQVNFAALAAPAPTLKPEATPRLIRSNNLFGGKSRMIADRSAHHSFSSPSAT